MALHDWQIIDSVYTVTCRRCQVTTYGPFAYEGPCIPTQYTHPGECEWCGTGYSPEQSFVAAYAEGDFHQGCYLTWWTHRYNRA